MRKAFKPIALSLLVLVNHYSTAITAFGEPSNMVEEMKKLKPGDTDGIEKLKYKYYYKSKIEKLNAMSARNRAATKKADEAADKAALEAKKSGKATAAIDDTPKKGSNSPSKPASTASSNNSSKRVSKTESAPSAPIKVDSNTPDELNFPGKDEE